MTLTTQDLKYLFNFRGYDTSKIVIDHRQAIQDSIFIGLQGIHHNGSDFAIAAINNGAQLALVNYNINSSKSIILQNCYNDGLLKIAQYQRNQYKGKIIGITGSVGKTTLKDMLYFLLSNYNQVYKSTGNFNNHYGLPLTLCNLDQKSKYTILEMGMNHIGEIRTLADIAQHHIAIITAIEPAHLENFNNLEHIAQAKCEILAPWCEKAIINKDSNFHLIKSDISYITYGYYDADIYIHEVNHIDKKIIARYGNNYIEYSLITIKKSLIYASLASLSLLIYLNYSHIEIQEIFNQLQYFIPTQGRGNIISINGIEIIDESYNANPASMIDSIEFLSSFKNKRKIAILGDMMELGDNALQLHLSLKQYLSHVDKVCCIGDMMHNLFNTLPRAQQGFWCKNNNDMINYLKDFIQINDLVMIKGSNSLKMNNIVQAIQEIFR